jgi:hypothetical protein
VSSPLDWARPRGRSRAGAPNGWPLLLTAARSLGGHRHAEGLIEQLVTWSRKLTVTGRLQEAYKVTFHAETSQEDIDA